MARTTAIALLALLVAGCGGHQPRGPVPVPTPRATVTAAAAASVSRRLVLGRSEAGRRIVAFQRGDPHGPPALVVGSVHGTELAGVAVARALERVRTAADLWIVPNLNPDGAARGTRQNARGVDLNANWSAQWRGGGRPWDVYYGGSRPFSERETRIARALIRRVRPRLTVWFHQHMDVVWAWGPSTAAGRRYAPPRSPSSCPPAASPRPRSAGRCEPCWRAARPRPARCSARAARPRRAAARRARLRRAPVGGSVSWEMDVLSGGWGVIDDAPGARRPGPFQPDSGRRTRSETLGRRGATAVMGSQ